MSKEKIRKSKKNLKLIVSYICLDIIIDRYNETNSYKDRPRPGRPKNRTEPSHVLTNQWKLSNGKTASSSLVRKRLLANKPEWKVAVKKPRLSTKHIKDRKTFCKMVKSLPCQNGDNRKNPICIRSRQPQKSNLYS
ncbi:unnamed protein product [Brachionus calyciflorus]|uniref:Uncharacterized protein n=1 Tax=Brachionus calyciflorus TaxID=104777 RepID=A0A813MIM6_9BILA|nr:unnamed protein product [Brachionus calyciflorus]